MTFSLQQLSDRYELTELLSRYATCVDYKNYEELATLFTPDATLDYSAAGGASGTVTEVLQWMESVLGMFASTQHLISNPVITVEEDTAKGRFMCFNPMPFPGAAGPQQHVMFNGLWYSVSFVKSDQQWKIASLSQEFAYMHNVPQAMADAMTTR